MGMIEFKFGKDQYHLQEEIRAWCRSNFGPGMWCNPKDHTQIWGFDHAFGNTTYYFKNEKDAIIFTLRWT
jgi:hypothetical protein